MPTFKVITGTSVEALDAMEANLRRIDRVLGEQKTGTVTLVGYGVAFRLAGAAGVFADFNFNKAVSGGQLFEAHVAASLQDIEAQRLATELGFERTNLTGQSNRKEIQRRGTFVFAEKFRSAIELRMPPMWARDP